MRSLVPGIAVLLASTTLAQTASLTSLDPSRGANLPPAGAALADEATAAAVNPAGLARAGGLQLHYVFERSLARAQTAHGIYFSTSGPLSMGLTADWVGGALPHSRWSWALAAGSEALSIGFDYHWLSSRADPALDGLGALDVGLLSRPLPQLSLGAVVRNADQPASSPSPRSYVLALGLRPLGERATVGVDYLFGDSRPFEGRLQYTLQAELLRGLRLLAGASHGLRAGDELLFQLGITLDTSVAGTTYTVGAAPSGLSQGGALRISSQQYRDFTGAGGTVALFDLPDLLRDGGAFSLLGLGAREEPFIRVTRLLAAAERDANLRGIVLKIDDLPGTGLAKLQELRQAVLRLRQAGKKVVAVVLNAEDPEYLLASAADRVYAFPQAALRMDGLRAETRFFGGTMEKLGVTWDVARVGAYKNSPDQLTRTGMSPEQEEALTAYLDSTFQQLRKQVSERPSVALDRALEAALVPPALARELGLVDKVISPADLDREVAELLPGARFEPHYAPFSRRDEAWGRRRRIAVVPVVGTIAGGKSRRDGLTGSAIAGAETIIQGLTEASEDGRVAAIVLRVDSPGGDGLASDLIYRAVLEAKAKKPVVASMGDHAASGGYYAAMGAHEIFASPATLTGSIGVFYLKPALGELLGKLGVTHQVLTRGKFADFATALRPWTPEERQIAQAWVDAFYDGFITEVSTSRGTTKEKIDAVARGRIWSGADALERGLVDHLGGLHDAIDAARRRASIPPGAPVDLVEYGGQRSLLAPSGGEEGVLERVAGALLSGAPSAPPLAGVVDLGAAPTVLLDGKVLALEPVLPEVR